MDMTAEGSLNDPELLEEMYWGKNMTMGEIGEKFDCSRSTVSRRLKENNIRTRDKSEAKKVSTDYSKYPWRDEDLLREMYWEEKKSVNEIADEFGTNGPHIIRWMDKLGIERRDQSDAMHIAIGDGIKNVSHYWNNGYETVKVNGTSYSIHRLIAISEYGTEVVKGNDVHHKNEVKWDNRPENLEVVTQKEHGEKHGENQYTSQERPWTDKELFKRKYVEESMSRKELADEWDCTPGTISRWRKEHDINRQYNHSE